MIKRLLAIIMTAMFAFFLVKVDVEASSLETPSPGLGEIRQFLYGKAPVGWFYCNGQYIDKQSYNDLYTKIGDTFGAQEVNTFAIPDLRQHEKLEGVGYYISPTGMAAEVQLSSGEVYMGEMRIYPYTIELPNILKAEGQEMPIMNNQALYALMGINFGGNGHTNFKLPNFNEVFQNQANVYGYIVTSGMFPPYSETNSSDYSSKQYTGEISFVVSSLRYTGINVTNQPNQLLNQSVYPGLYDIIGTRIGGSDADGTFMLPSPIDQLKGKEIFHIQGNGVTPTITPKALPTATEDTLYFSATEARETKTLNILANDSADARDPKIIYSLMGNNSSISLNADGMMTYKWNDEYATSHEFYYRAYNNYGGTQLTKVSVMRPQANVISFMNQNAPYSTVQALYNGELVTKPADPSRTGYTFAGWYTDDADTTAYDFATPVTASFTLYAKWTKNPTYTVTYYGNGSTAGQEPTDSNEYEANETATVKGNENSLVKQGYTFAGWNTKADGTGTDYAENATFQMSTSNITLYAQWTKNPTYTVTYDGNTSTAGQVPADSNEYEANETATVKGNANNLVKQGYTFVGWNTKADGTGTSYAAGATLQMGTSNITLYAQWTKNPTYTVTYDGNGSTAGQVPADSNEYEANETAIVKGNGNNLVKQGYTFAGWNTKADGTGTDYVAGATVQIGASNITLYVQWAKNPTYTVTYDGNTSTAGQVPADSNEYEANETATVKGNANNLVKQGYTFVGWNTKADGTGADYAENATFQMSTSNITLYAQWAKNPTYTVTYDGNGSTAGQVPADSNEYEANETATVKGNANNLVKQGYTFVGWNTKADGTGTSYAAGATVQMGTSNITLYAQWTKNPTYTVTYDGNTSTAGQVPADSNEYEANETATVKGNANNLVKQGYTFVGWNTKADGTGTSYAAGATVQMGTSNITLYAQWTKNPTYTVTYDGNGSTAGQVPADSNEYEANETATVKGYANNLVKQGYTFVGWNTKADGTGADYAAGASYQMGASNITLYAKWMVITTPSPTPNPTPTPDYPTAPPVNPEPPTPSSITIKFETSDGTVIEALDLPANAAIHDLPVPTKEGFTFAGWYQDKELQNRWQDGTKLIQNMTLYAKWEQLPSEPETPSQPIGTFTDTEGHWANDIIEKIAAQGIITGYEDGTFRPNESVSRKHIALMLTRALDLQPVRLANAFHDVSANHAYYDAIMKLANAGIIDGDQGNYNPDEPMTRAQLAKVLVLAFGLTPGGSSDYADVADTHWGAPYIAALADTGIALGDNGHFHPNEPVTRAQFVTFLYRALNF